MKLKDFVIKICKEILNLDSVVIMCDQKIIYDHFENIEDQNDNEIKIKKITIQTEKNLNEFGIKNKSILYIEVKLSRMKIQISK